MKTFFKIIIWFVVGVIAFFLLAFIYGMYLGVVNPSKKPPIIKQKIEKSSGRQKNKLELPEKINADTIAIWLISKGYIDIKGKNILYNKEKFKNLGAKNALKIYKTLKSSKQAKKYQSIRLIFFSLCSYLEKKERAMFSKKSGAALPDGINWGKGSYRGDYLKLFYMYDSGKNREIYAHALQEYAKILSDKEMVYTLKQYGAYHEDLDADWSIRVREKMSHYDGKTLLSFYNAIDTQFLNQRKYLRKEIFELIEEKKIKK